MGCSLSRLPDVDRPFVVRSADGLKLVLASSPRLFLEVLQRIIDISIALPYRFERFDSLALLEEKYKNPQPDQSAMVSGQGMAIFNASLGIDGTWVLASDDTTPIT